MNLTSPTQIKELLERYETRATKRFGQNFLINKGILEKIVQAGNIKKDDLVLEVGPGLGTLTKELAQNAGKVIAIEKDKKMAAILNDVLKEEMIENVEIINKDVLKLDLGSGILNIESNARDLEKSKGYSKLNAFEGKSEERNEPYSKVQQISPRAFNEQMRQFWRPYKLIANIPYNITSSLIRKFLETENKPTEMILMVQKEVAQRICEKKKMSLLSLSVQFYANPEILFYVSKGSFFPSPNVDSAVIKISPKKEAQKNTEKFFKVIRAGFSSPRKFLIGNLSDKLKIKRDVLEEIFLQNDLNKKVRAEELSLQDWITLSTTPQLGSPTPK